VDFGATRRHGWKEGRSEDEGNPRGLFIAREEGSQHNESGVRFENAVNSHDPRETHIESTSQRFPRILAIKRCNSPTDSA
jgi:hypothetical protein